MQKRCPMQIGPIRRDKTVLSGSYGNKTVPTATGKAQGTRWASGDVMPWCSKLGDYMLAAPPRLVLLRRPNCSAILSFLRSVVKARRWRMLCYTVQLLGPLKLQEQRWGVHLKIRRGLLPPDIVGDTSVIRWSSTVFLWLISFFFTPPSSSHRSKRPCVRLCVVFLMLHHSGDISTLPDLPAPHLNKRRKKHVVWENAFLLRRDWRKKNKSPLKASSR